jgi:hypothetical protein
MSEIELIEKNINGKNCHKVMWLKAPIGLIFEQSENIWRISDDLKGEFWTFSEYGSKEESLKALIGRKQSLDEVRLKNISDQS